MRVQGARDRIGKGDRARFLNDDFRARPQPLHHRDVDRAMRDLRRAELGQHHQVSGQYLLACALEVAWRKDNRQ